MTDRKSELIDFEYEKLPANLFFGTSTWTYPSWKGLIYHKKYKNEKEFKATSLEEYANFPLFKAVGIDSTFYSPPTPELLNRYASMVPDEFIWISKVWERITIPHYPSHARYGKLAGTKNADFLNSKLFIDAVLAPYKDDAIKHHTGPFVFQFPTISKPLLKETDFLNSLKRFLEALPTDFMYTIELRNPDLLTNEYFDIINTLGVAHCFNHWNYMPPLVEQMKTAATAGGLTSKFFVARILTPRGINYNDAVKLFQPYDSIKKPIPEMRADVVRLAKRAMERNIPAFVIVNNRAEGNSPTTIAEIEKMIIEDLP